MNNHEASQRRVESLRVGNHIASPGVAGLVLAMGPIYPADKTRYAGRMLLTTVAGNDYTPFRSALWYFDDDAGRWQSESGQNYQSLSGALKGFKERTGMPT